MRTSDSPVYIYDLDKQKSFGVSLTSNIKVRKSRANMMVQKVGQSGHLHDNSHASKSKEWNWIERFCSLNPVSTYSHLLRKFWCLDPTTEQPSLLLQGTQARDNGLNITINAENDPVRYFFNCYFYWVHKWFYQNSVSNKTFEYLKQKRNIWLCWSNDKCLNVIVLLINFLIGFFSKARMVLRKNTEAHITT